MIESETIYLSTIVAGELFAGFHRGKRISDNRRVLLDFIDKPNVELFDVTIETSEIFGEIKSQLKKTGKMIPLNDIWIAAQTIVTGSKLITCDKHFNAINGLRVWDEINRYNG
ncbi:PIN domain-containing protein [Spirochaeta dissipatitropha]